MVLTKALGPGPRGCGRHWCSASFLEVTLDLARIPALPRGKELSYFSCSFAQLHWVSISAPGLLSFCLSPAVQCFCFLEEIGEMDLGRVSLLAIIFLPQLWWVATVSSGYRFCWLSPRKTFLPLGAWGPMGLPQWPLLSSPSQLITVLPGLPPVQPTQDGDLSASAAPRLHTSPYPTLSNPFLLWPNSVPRRQRLGSRFSLLLPSSSFQESCLPTTSVPQWFKKSHEFSISQAFFLAIRVGALFFPALYSHGLKLEILWFFWHTQILNFDEAKFISPFLWLVLFVFCWVITVYELVLLTDTH